MAAGIILIAIVIFIKKENREEEERAKLIMQWKEDQERNRQVIDMMKSLPKDKTQSNEK